MHPAGSVIAFTTVSGVGFGMMIWLGLGFAPRGDVAGPVAGLIALVLGAAGLSASLLHLGNPQRAWRALSQWRSSWLSREGVVSIALMAVFFAFIASWALGWGRSPWLGGLAALLALGALVCTAMIYGSLRAVPRWSSPWTAPMFVAFALAGGIVATTTVALTAGEGGDPLLALIVLAAAGIVAWLRRRKALARGLDHYGDTPETATGLTGRGEVRLLEKPHTSPNYLMKEMVFRVGRRHAAKLARIAAALGFALPGLLIALALAAPGLAAALFLLALLSHVAGTLVSRWLFFAEAEHVVGLYYGLR